MFWFWQHRREIDLTLCGLLLTAIVLFYLWIWTAEFIAYIGDLRERFRRWRLTRKFLRRAKKNDRKKV